MSAGGHGFGLFETAIGCCGIAWGPRGVLRVQLPGGSLGETRARLRLLAIEGARVKGIPRLDPEAAVAHTRRSARS